MQEQLSTFRLNLMRLLYLMIFLFLASSIWPLLFNHKPWDPMYGVAMCLLAALGFLMAFGLRYPVRMLPILMFEFLWKTIWTVAIGMPLWRAGQIDADTMETTKACAIGAIFCIGVIPWGFVWRYYVREPGDRWRGPARGAT